MSRLVLMVATLVLAAPLAAQDQPVSVRFRLAEEVRIGRAAPAVVLPYATREGIGPADQPFTLTKELGRVVVLAFYPGDFTPGCTAEWRAFAERATSMFGEGVVLVGISSDSLATHLRFARELDLPFKLLSDPDLRVTRTYGAADGARARRVVVVIGRDGRVRHVDPAFAALDPQSYVQLGAAIEAARKERP
jgi:peroxiredoxin Q/BCP